MTRSFGVVAMAMAVLAVGSLAVAQNSRPALPMSGAVVDLQGSPVAGANVLLSRLATSARGARGFETVAQARTDAQGRFTFGSVRLDTSVAFPLETGVRFEYSVQQDNRQRAVSDVSYTAPRDRSGVVESINASIHVQ